METTNKVLRVDQVMEVTGARKSTLYLWMKQGNFPRQIKIGPKAVGWLHSDVQAWISSRIAATHA